MTVSYKGLDCLADKDTAAFMMYHKESQAKVAWMDQPHYGKVTVYFGRFFLHFSSMCGFGILTEDILLDIDLLQVFWRRFST